MNPLDLTPAEASMIAEPLVSDHDAQYLAAGLGAPFRPISFDPLVAQSRRSNGKYLMTPLQAAAIRAAGFDQHGFKPTAEVAGNPPTTDLPALPREPILGTDYVRRPAPAEPLVSDHDAQYLAAGLGAPFRPISFDPALAERPAATLLPSGSSNVEQVPVQINQVTDCLHACAASLADLAHQLALCAAALHQTPAGSVPTPQSDPEGLL